MISSAAPSTAMCSEDGEINSVGDSEESATSDSDEDEGTSCSEEDEGTSYSEDEGMSYIDKQCKELAEKDMEIQYLQDTINNLRTTVDSLRMKNKHLMSLVEEPNR